MFTLILIIVGVVAVGLGVYFGQKTASVKIAGGKRDENLEKLWRMIESRERMSNDDVEKALGVSDATATRYLDELEKQGFIRQVGKEGKYVYYEKTP